MRNVINEFNRKLLTNSFQRLSKPWESFIDKQNVVTTALYSIVQAFDTIF